MKILMVCLGNICRSPLAHGVMQALVSEKHLDWVVDSAGTGDWHVGQAPDRRAIAIAERFGVDISGQRAQHLRPEHLDVYDHILVMDHSNLRHVQDMARNKQQRERIALFLGDAEVPDPYYDDRLFEPVYRLVEARCKVLLHAWKSGH